MRSLSRERAVVTAPSALESKEHPAGPSKVPLRKIRQAIYPPRRIPLRNVEDKAPWRVLDMTNLPSSPRMASRNEVWKVEGVSTFSLCVLVRGHGVHITTTTTITGVRSNQDLIRCVKIWVYMGFSAHRGS